MLCRMDAHGLPEKPLQDSALLTVRNESSVDDSQKNEASVSDWKMFCRGSMACRREVEQAGDGTSQEQPGSRVHRAESLGRTGGT